MKTEEMNRITANEIADKQALTLEAKGCLSDMIFVALQIVQKRGEILERQRQFKEPAE